MLPEKDAQMLDSLRAKLMRRIKLEDGALLRELRSREVITEEQVQEIQKTRAGFKQVGKLLDFLSHGCDTTLDELISAMRAAGLVELADECFGESAESEDTSQRQPGAKTRGAAVRLKVEQPEAKTQTPPEAETGNQETSQKQPGAKPQFAAGPGPSVRPKMKTQMKIHSETQTPQREEAGSRHETLQAPVRKDVPKREPTIVQSQATEQMPKGTRTGMSLRCKLAILKSYEEFVKDLDVNPTVDRMLSKLIFTQEECQRIRSKQSEHEKRRLLLDLLPEKGNFAFEELCACLRTNQSWLLDTLDMHLNTITEAELDEANEAQHMEFGKGLTRQRLQETLRKNALKYARNDPSRILTDPKTAPGPYLIQSITTYKETGGRQREKIDTTDVFKMLANSSSGQRLFIYGTAGMGKSSLCREIVRLWAEGDSRLCDQFSFMFPIPLQSVRSHGLLDVICDDLRLLPSFCKGRLQEEMELNPEKVLFVLDSFEELNYKEQDEEIIRLIKGDSLTETTVLLTTRPNPQVEELASNVRCSRINGNLQNLTHQQVETYIEDFPNLDSSKRAIVGRTFGGSFLQRPINLWLLCYVAVTTAGLGLGLPGSQTVLLNIIMQHILLAYQKKKNRALFELTDKSPLTILEHDEIKIMIKEAGKLSYIAVRENTHVLNLTGSMLSQKGLLELGLFADGPEENTVVLPHELFKEYLAALYLSAEETARNDLLKKIEDESLSREKGGGHGEGVEKQHSQQSTQKKLGLYDSDPQGHASGPAPAHPSPRPCLVDILRSKGLDNVIRFLVGLLPATANQLSKLFVIKQSRVRTVSKFGPGKDEEVEIEHDEIHSFLYYELDLFHECSDPVTQTSIARALLEVDTTNVGGYSDYVPNRGSHFLLNHFTADERERFLAKFYNCQLLVIDGRLVLLSEGNSFFCDSFVAGFIVLHNCVVESEELLFYRAHLPVQLIAHHMADVGGLRLTDCMLYRDTAEFVTSLGLKDSPTDDMSKKLATTSQSVVGTLVVSNVRGLRQLTSQYVMPATRGLVVALCDVTLAEVRQTFPAVSVLWFGGCDMNFFSPATTLTSAEDLTLYASDNIHFTTLRETFPRLETLELDSVTVLIDDTDSYTAWETLSELTLDTCHVKHKNNSLSEEQATRTLAQLCPWTIVDIEDYEDDEETPRTVYEAYRRSVASLSVNEVNHNWVHRSHKI